MLRESVGRSQGNPVHTKDPEEGGVAKMAEVSDFTFEDWSKYYSVTMLFFHTCTL
jgi:hypothetical protein